MRCFVPVSIIALALLAGCRAPTMRASCVIGAMSVSGAAARAPLPDLPVTERDPEKLVCRGLILHAHGRTEQAMADVRTAIALAAPDEAWLIAGAGATVLADGGDVDAARNAWAQGVSGAERVHQRIYAWNFRDRRAVFLARHGDYREAREDWGKVYADDSDEGDRADLAFNIANIGASTNDPALVDTWGQRARRHAQRAGKLETEWKSLVLLGQSRTNAGDPAGALRWHQAELETADKIGGAKHRIDSREAVGEAWFDNDDYLRGADFYRQAIELSRTSDEQRWADFLHSQLRTRLLIFESGNRCIARLQEGAPAKAANAVEAVPAERRTVDANLCEATALQQQNQLSEALLVLRRAAEIADGYDNCKRLIDRRSELGGGADDLCERRFPDRAG